MVFQLPADYFFNNDLSRMRRRPKGLQNSARKRPHDGDGWEPHVGISTCDVVAALFLKTARVACITT